MAAGCGTVHDMRAEYVAHRALAAATTEAEEAAPRVTRIVASLDLAYRLRGQDPRFAERLAGLYHEFGRYQSALRCYEIASRAAPGHYDLEIAVCRLGLGQTPTALREIDRMLGAAPPTGAAVLNLVGYTMLDVGVRTEDAFAMVQEAARLAPLESAIVDSLGWGYYRKGDYRNAAFYLERAARLSPQDSAEELWHLGVVHARLGQYRRALDELQSSLKLDPDNPRARGALERLQRELPPPARA